MKKENAGRGCSVLRYAVLGALFLGAGGCVKLTLAWADLEANGAAAEPPVFSAPTLRAADLSAHAAPGAVTPEAYRAEVAPALRSAFERSVYGVMPQSTRTEVISRRLLDAAAFNGAGRLEELRLAAVPTFGGVEGARADWIVDIVTPAGAAAPSPVILIEAFCPRWNTIPHPLVSRPEGARGCDTGNGFLNRTMSGLMTYVFGRYIATPPLEAILARGYAVAAIYPGEVVPDEAASGEAALEKLAAGHDDPSTRWGAVAAWAWIYAETAGALSHLETVDAGRAIAWGHSRYGKAALVAAAFDDRIGGVIAHQSGTGGASLNRRKKGESVGEITKSYPHWFAPAYAPFAGREEALPVDQHQLLALIAPRPVLLGNARRDVWSDPNGAFRAAIGADPVYELLGADGLEQTRLDEFRPDADLAFWIRPGTHGVVEEDWPAFLDFLDAHFGTSGAPTY